ncbi:MAG: hypothetical protein ACI8QC_000757 [Planctomycetota bacterium]|jgi:hypothetical protein
MGKFRNLIRQLAALLVILSLYGAWSHGLALDSVRVSLLEGQSEVGDGLLGVPDYRLDVKGEGEWVELGVFENTPMGQGLEWRVPGALAMQSLKELRLVEVDLANDDVLESRPVNGTEFDGQSYQYVLTARRDFMVAFGWFFNTPLGAISSMGILIFGLLILLTRGRASDVVAVVSSLDVLDVLD